MIGLVPASMLMSRAWYCSPPVLAVPLLFKLIFFVLVAGGG
jgi:flagellar biosynthesis protein FliP